MSYVDICIITVYIPSVFLYFCTELASTAKENKPTDNAIFFRGRQMQRPKPDLRGHAPLVRESFRR